MRLIWSAPALDDLRGIDDWLTREASAGVALRNLAAIRFRAKFLQDFPRGGRPLQNGQRVLVVYDTPYLIRYQIIDRVVSVVRVHHEREGWLLDP
ncbi:conserved hypothetical protein [Sphingomonas sp. EC-HK361]|uniref:type II toxin-antitoxin system RelE/ParE family toxin n=1 Tax=Sphingomonas sp. EC-HK361 TaxID=2038397 RepID=UPI00125572EC|nr:type II toxin-antitoxin system RelE/ParE family toxin [Sphingomonas sp. EC-HK361]VVT24379.1 conserved hypothetical protein [Sphingomonas sp. EC-HK361]